MMEDITVEEGLCPDVQMSSSEIKQEVVLVSDPLELPSTFETCPGSPLKRKTDSPSISTSLQIESHHLNAICLNIRIAIIRCFYSSSSCPTTALQMLKEEEDNNLCFTVNVEDINFFVQKFEKTGSVIANQTDSPGIETEDMVNPHSMVETIFDSPFEYSAGADDSDDELCDPIYSPYKQVKKRKRKSPLIKKRKKEQNSDGLESQPSQPQNEIPLKKKTSPNQVRKKVKIPKISPLLWKRKRAQSTTDSKETLLSSEAYEKSENKNIPPNQSGEKIKSENMSQKFPPLGKNECRICKKKCPDVLSFTYHFLNHFNMTFLPKEGPYKCPGCFNNYTSSKGFYGHLFRRCFLEKYDSPEYQQNSDSKWNSSASVNSTLSEKDNGSLTSNQSSFLQDQVEKKGNKTEENITSSQKSKKKIHKCPRCSKILPDKRSLTYHVLDHFNLDHLIGDPPYKCPGGCDQIFVKKETLYNHLVATCHKVKKASDTSFNCHLCNKAFQFEIQLEHHILVHSGKAKLKECNFCGKKFNTTTGFRYHLVSTHAEKKAHQCDQCPRYFASLKLLEEHKMSHSGTYLFICEICGKNCDNSSSFRLHLRRHSQKSTQWQCELCGKYYCGKDYKKSYEQHMRVHTGEIVAVCDLCGKGFNHKGNLKVHYKSCQGQGGNQSSGAKKKICRSSSGAVNLHSRDSGAITLHGRDSGAVTLHGRDSGTETLHGRDSGAVTLHGRDYGGVNLHSSESQGASFHSHESQEANLHGHDSGTLNLPSRNSGALNLHSGDSRALNLHNRDSVALNYHDRDSQTHNLHNRVSTALSLPSRDSGVLNSLSRDSRALNLHNRDSVPLNYHDHDSQAINLQSRQSQAINFHSRDSGAIDLHGCESGSMNLECRGIESLNSHGRGSEGLNLHGRGSDSLNLHCRGSDGLNLLSRTSDDLNLHGRGSEGLNLHGRGSEGLNLHGRGSEGLNLHGFGSRAVNLHGFTSSSATPQQAPLWFKYNQQWS